jgi:Na+-driven multidrug efflux pump
MEITTGLLRGIFRPMPAMISSIAGVCGFRILWIKTVFERYHSYTLLYLSYPISWFISFAVQGVLFLFYFKKYRESLIKFNKNKCEEKI